MVYTIKIEDTNPKAKRFIDLLKILKEDFNFIEIIADEDLDIIEENIDKELLRRYNLFVGDPNGKDWEVLRKELI